MFERTGRVEACLDVTPRVAEPFDRLDLFSPAALRRWWTARVRRVLKIAVTELPFYRDRFGAAGFDVASFRTLDDLARLPTFRKKDMLAWQRERGSHRLGIERSIDRDAGETL